MTLSGRVSVAVLWWCFAAELVELGAGERVVRDVADSLRAATVAHETHIVALSSRRD
jgi:hypothetical protein